MKRVVQTGGSLVGTPRKLAIVRVDEISSKCMEFHSTLQRKVPISSSKGMAGIPSCRRAFYERFSNLVTLQKIENGISLEEAEWQG